MLKPGSRWCLIRAPAALTPGKETPGTNYVHSTLGKLQSQSGRYGKEKISSPYPNSNPGSSNPYRSYDTDYASPVSSQTIEDQYYSMDRL
jgi:hypothetical protein